MRTLLRLLGSLLVVWAVVLLLLRDRVLASTDLNPFLHAMANGWGLSNLVFGVLLWSAARDPAHNLAVVYAAIALSGLRTLNDLYGMLALPPAAALVSLADLVLSVGIFVGVLRELPRTLAAARGTHTAV